MKLTKIVYDPINKGFINSKTGEIVNPTPTEDLRLILVQYESKNDDEDHFIKRLEEGKIIPSKGTNAYHTTDQRTQVVSGEFKNTYIAVQFYRINKK